VAWNASLISLTKSKHHPDSDVVLSGELVTLWQQQADKKEPGSTDEAKVFLTAILLVHSGNHSSCYTRYSYPTKTKFTNTMKYMKYNAPGREGTKYFGTF